jgi:hypothetical protein
MLAAAAAMAAPSAVFAMPVFSGFESGETLIVSGRIVDRAGKPLAGARLATEPRGSTCEMTLTDGDGRFMLTTTVAAAGGYVEYGPERAGPSGLVRARLAYREAPSRFQRDEQGVWRTTCTLRAS